MKITHAELEVLVGMICRQLLANSQGNADSDLTPYPALTDAERRMLQGRDRLLVGNVLEAKRRYGQVGLDLDSGGSDDRQR